MLEEQNKDIEEATKVIKDYLNTINDSLKVLDENGYNTKDIYAIYDMLRYDLLNNKNIEEFYSKDLLEEITKKLNTYNYLLNNIVKELNVNSELLLKNESKQYEINEKLTKNNPKYRKLDTKIKDKTRFAILSLLTASNLIGGAITINKTVDSVYKSPLVDEYNIDSLGHHSHSVRYDKRFDSNYIIDDYSKCDEEGNRTKKTYVLPSVDVLNSEALKDMDLSKLEPVNVTTVNVEWIDKITKDEYRDCHYEIQNTKLSGKTTDVKSNEKNGLVGVIIIECLTILTFQLILINKFADMEIHGDIPYNLLENIYKNNIKLAKYKIMLSKELKKLEALDKDKQKYEKIINTLEKRIDKVIIESVEQVALIEDKLEYKKMTDVNKTNNKFKEVRNKEEDNKKEKIENIQKIIKILSSEMDGLDKLNSKESEKLLHSVPITESLLLERVDDHYKIKDMFMNYLKFLDFSLISFDDVDIRNIDFSETNAVIDLRRVYNKDASYCKFNNRNIHDWANYEGINLSGSYLEENPTTMINLDKAITNSKTMINNDKESVLRI